MKKIFFRHTNIFFLFLVLFILASSSLLLSIPNQKTPEIRSKAAGNTLNACQEGCQYSGPAGLQQAVDAASDGDVINISGTLVGSSQFSPFNGRLAVQSCFVDLRGKSLTLKGGTLYGEGHAKGTHEPGDPLYHRAGICSTGGKVMLDKVRINQFEGGGGEFINTTLILKNSTVDGNDHGGIFLINSPVLAVNNYFVSTQVSLMPDKATVLAFNNTFFHTKSVVMSCRNDPPPITFKNNIVYDPENIGGYDGPCPSQVAKIDKNGFSHDLFWMDGRNCYDNEFCQEFPGRIVADPILKDIAWGPEGWAYGSLDLRPESPAVGKGDPAIPGKLDLGAGGGPCADGNSAVCQNFIEQQKSSLQPPAAPTEALPTAPPYQPSENNPTEPVNNPTRPPSNDNGPPITYYLPPTMGFARPTQVPGALIQKPPAGGEEISPTPTATPTPKPLIDVKKTVDNAKNTWNNLVVSFINFTKTILP